MPFVEPESLRHGLPMDHLPVPNFATEDRAAYLQLAEKWDSLGLLDFTSPMMMRRSFARSSTHINPRSGIDRLEIAEQSTVENFMQLDHQPICRQASS